MKNEFIDLAIKCNALKFGDFTLKSGRTSPYFFNAGMFYTGSVLAELGGFYAQAIINSTLDFQHLFGPAYKGLPLATATAIALSAHGRDVSVTFNRKEIKDHGEGGQLIGAPLTGKTIIIDDVITAGTAFREAQALINANGGQVKAAVITLDRCEKGLSESSAISDIRAQGIEVISIINFFDLTSYLQSKGDFKVYEKLMIYHKKFGVEVQRNQNIGYQP